MRGEFEVIRAGVLGDVAHGFFGSGAGAHQFGYGGPGSAEGVRAARAEAAATICAGARLATPHQVHSPEAVTVIEAWEDSAEGRPVADAVVTAQRGIALGIVTADCGPILFADSKAGVIAAAHAGWRGAHGGVIENTVQAMEALGASRPDIAAAIGPTIAQESYEVDAGFRQNFTATDESLFVAAPLRDGRERWHFDLPGYIAARLRNAGIVTAENLALDTFANSERFYSYRRSTQSQEPNYGRQISIIALGETRADPA